MRAVKADERLAGIVWDVLEHCVGRERAIPREALLEAVRARMPGATDRAVRDTINWLRKKGKPICSAGGSNGGYWVAKNWAEFQEFLEREWRPRYLDMMETEKAMRQGAMRIFGPQPSLLEMMGG